MHIPAGVDAAKFAPMLCAGSTVFSALNQGNLVAGDTVAVQGLGGLGHMAVQFARKMGYRVVAISRGTDKEKSVRALGAHEYIDSTAGDAGEALAKLGSAKLILTTAMDTAAIVPLVKGIGIYGKLIILSVPQPSTITIDAMELLMGGRSVQSIPVGHSHEVQKAIDFAHLQGLECAIEKFPLDKANDAFGTFF